MFTDNNLYFADAQAYGTATSANELDLGQLPGNTRDLDIWFEGNALAAAGAMTVDLQTSATSGSGHATDALFTRTPAELNEGQHFSISMRDLNRYAQIVIGGSPSAGTWTCFIIDGMGKQTAR